MEWSYDDRKAAEEAILKHAGRLESGELTWVNTIPAVKGHACIGYVFAISPKVLVCISDRADAVLDQEAKQAGFETFVDFNDNGCESASEAVEFLRRAAKRVWL